MKKYAYIENSKVYHIAHNMASISKDRKSFTRTTSLCSLLDYANIIETDTIPLTSTGDPRSLCKHCIMEQTKLGCVAKDASVDQTEADDLFESIVKDVEEAPEIPINCNLLYDNTDVDEILKELQSDSQEIYYGDIKDKIRDLERQTERLKKELERADFTVNPGDRVLIDGVRYMYAVSTPGSGHSQRGVLVNGKGYALTKSITLPMISSSALISDLIPTSSVSIYSIKKLSGDAAI